MSTFRLTLTWNLGPDRATGPIQSAVHFTVPDLLTARNPREAFEQTYYEACRRLLNEAIRTDARRADLEAAERIWNDMLAAPFRRRTNEPTLAELDRLATARVLRDATATWTDDPRPTPGSSTHSRWRAGLDTQRAP